MLEEMTMNLLLDLGYDCKNGYDMERDFIYFKDAFDHKNIL